MAATERGAALTEQQRLAQQQVRRGFLAEFLALWVLLDSTRLDETGPGWVRAVLRLIPPFRARSAEVATRYYNDFRTVEAPAPGVLSPLRPAAPVERPPRRSPRSPEPARTASGARQDQRTPPDRVAVAPRDRRTRLDLDESAFGPGPERRTRIEIPDIDWGPSDRAAEVSLIVTGPVGQKSKAKRGKTLGVARDESFVDASGAASRHVLTGGRQSLLKLLGDDPQALGWARVTDGDPCAWCSMLAGRGPVYRSEASASFPAHPSCACTAEPVYSRDAPWPGRAAEFRALYRESTRGYSGQDAINAYRRAYERQQRDARRSDVA